MPIALTCVCGARFEIDDSYAGQDWTCPDCSAPVRAPRKTNTAPRPSWLALFAAALVLVGSFTVVGSLAAAVLGTVALYRIRALGGQLGGGRIALAAIAGGLLLSVATVVLWARPGSFPVALWLRYEWFYAGQVEMGGSLEALGSDASLKRPSKLWGRAVRGRTTHPVMSDTQKGRDLLLANLTDFAFADVARLAVSGTASFEEMVAPITDDMNPERPAIFGGITRAPSQQVVLLPSRQPENVDEWRRKEWMFDVTRAGQHWRFIVRAYRKQRGAASDPVFVVRAYCPARSFARLESELRQILDSLRILR